MYQEKNMVRISITLPKALLEDFDEYADNFGYKKRSEAIRDAMREFIKDNLSLHLDTVIDGYIIIGFDHHQRGLVDELNELEHHSPVQVSASMHVHVSEDNCSEVISVRGRTRDIDRLKEQILELKGIVFCEVFPLYIFHGKMEEHGELDAGHDGTTSHGESHSHGPGKK